MSLFLKYWVRYAGILDQVLRYAFVILFVYAGMSKLLDFETFQVQLAQSPLLSAYAGFVAWAVPLSEFLIAILLLVERTRVWGLSGFFFLMVMFTTYIIIILNFADFIPCSCGGVLEKMSWGQHLVFNVVFVLVSGLLLFFQFSGNWRRRVLLLGSQVVLGVGVVSVLFAFSEKKMHRNNAFVRRYPHHPVFPVDTLDLKFNSYYFAGSSQYHFYLGNYTAPKQVLCVSQNLKDTVSFRIKMPEDDIKYKNPRLRIVDHSFLLFDGSVPIIHKGSILDWTVKQTFHPKAFFTQAEAADTETLIIRAVSKETGNNLLGTILLDSMAQVQLFPEVLKGNIDGYFDRDGQLLFNDQKKEFVYIYYYKNEFIMGNKIFKTIQTQHTIDTINNPQIYLGKIGSSGIRSLDPKSVRVNGISSSFSDYLLIQSDRLGKFEPDDIKADIIDVYHIQNESYEFSFYLYHDENEKLLSYLLYGKNLYAIINEGLYWFEFKEQFLN